MTIKRVSIISYPLNATIIDSSAVLVQMRRHYWLSPLTLLSCSQSGLFEQKILSHLLLIYVFKVPFNGSCALLLFKPRLHIRPDKYYPHTSVLLHLFQSTENTQSVVSGTNTRFNMCVVLLAIIAVRSA